jgi:cell division protein FtsL
MSPAARSRSSGRGGKGSGRPRGRSIVALVLVSFVLVAVGVIWRRSYGFSREREISLLEQKRTQLEGERARLELEIRDLSSRARLAPIAEQRLGMRIPSDSQVIDLRRGPAAQPAAGTATRLTP